MASQPPATTKNGGLLIFNAPTTGASFTPGASLSLQWSNGWATGGSPDPVFQAGALAFFISHCGSGIVEVGTQLSFSTTPIVSDDQATTTIPSTLSPGNDYCVKARYNDLGMKTVYWYSSIFSVGGAAVSQQPATTGSIQSTVSNAASTVAPSSVTVETSSQPTSSVAAQSASAATTTTAQNVPPSSSVFNAPVTMTTSALPSLASSYGPIAPVTPSSASSDTASTNVASSSNTATRESTIASLPVAASSVGNAPTVYYGSGWVPSTMISFFVCAFAF